MLVHAKWPDGEAICPLRIRESRFGEDVATPFGFSGFAGRGDLSDFPERWRVFASSQPWVAGYLVVNPWLQTPPWRQHHGLHVHNALFALTLSDGPEALYQRLSRTRRRQLCRWHGEGRSLVTDRTALHAFVRDQSASFFGRINAAIDYRLGGAAWDMLFASDNVLALGAEANGQLVAVTIFEIGSEVADALFNISTPAGRDAATSLMWNGAKLLINRGVRILNMGGGLSPNDPVAEAKRRFGGDEVPFGALRQVYDRARYEAACQQASCDPSSTGVYFPPYRTAAGVREGVH